VKVKRKSKAARFTPLDIAIAQLRLVHRDIRTERSALQSANDSLRMRYVREEAAKQELDECIAVADENTRGYESDGLRILEALRNRRMGK